MNLIELKNSLKAINQKYTVDKWLDLEDITSISLSTATTVYPTNYSNGFKTQYFFDTNHELMYERVVDIDLKDESELVKSEYIFDDNTLFPTDYPVVVAIPFDLISMFQGSTVDNPREGYVLHN